MTIPQAHKPTPQKPLRLWPGVVIVVLQLLGLFVLPAVAPGATIYGMMAGAIGALAIFIWWAFFSRVPRIERWGAIVLTVVALAATRLVLHTSVAGAGMGMMFPIYGVISVSVALVVAALVGRRLPVRTRRAVLAASILLACGAWALIRTGGITGDADSDLAWRWSRPLRSGCWPEPMTNRQRPRQPRPRR